MASQSSSAQTDLRGYGPLRASSQPIEVHGMRVQVAALADIIRSKEAADRDKDRAALGTLRALEQELRGASGDPPTGS